MFSIYKDKYKQKANAIALAYISILQIALIFLSGCFLAAFLNQMHIGLMSQTKVITLFIIIAICIHFSNWMAYSGKSRKEMNAKYMRHSKQVYSINVLYFLPVAAVGFAFLLLQSL